MAPFHLSSGERNNMKIKIGKKEYRIKYGYKATLKERIISRTVQLDGIADDDGNINLEKIEDLMLFIPEMFLVGLQVNHKEFVYDYDTKDGKKAQLEKVYSIIEEYLSEDGNSPIALFNQLQEALKEDSFLSQMLHAEEKAQEAEKVLQTNEN